MAKSKLFTTTLTLPDGTRKYFRGKTKEEAERKKTEAKYRLGLGVRINDTTTFGEFAEMWYNIYKKPRLKSPNSKASALNILNNHLLPHLTYYALNEITPAHIQQTMNALEGKSETLNKKSLQYLRSIFRTAVDNGLIYKSPVTKSIKADGQATEEKVPLTTEQAQALLNAVKNTRAFPFVFLALNTGLRRGELLGLMWEDVDLDAGVIHVRHNAVFDKNKVCVSDNLKTPAARRTVPMPLPLTSYLTQHKADSRSEYVIPMVSGDPMTKNAFRAMWRLVEKRTVSADRKMGESPQKHSNVVYTLDFHVTPHLLRHTYITRLFDAGLDLKEVQYLAGHKTPDMTLRVYTHYMLEQRKAQTAAKIHAGFGPIAAAFVTPAGEGSGQGNTPKQVQHGCNDGTEKAAMTG